MKRLSYVKPRVVELLIVLTCIQLFWIHLAHILRGKLALCKSTKNKAKGVKIAYARHDGSTILGLKIKFL